MTRQIFVSDYKSAISNDNAVLIFYKFYTKYIIPWQRIVTTFFHLYRNLRITFVFLLKIRTLIVSIYKIKNEHQEC